MRDVLGLRAASPDPDPLSDARSLYIELLKRCVSNSIYDDDLDLMRGEMAFDPATSKFAVVNPGRADDRKKYLGQVWPSRAHTMIGKPRLDNLQFCVETAVRESVPGDLIETGVWRGGASILMRGILKAYGVSDRTVWVADSFEGLPPADRERYPKETGMDLHLARDLAVSLEQVQQNFARYGLLDDRVRFLKGWFRDTLPTAPIERLAVMRLDGDLYESTMDALVNLYDKLSPGGFVIIDDYNAFQCCNDAVEDFCKQRGIAPYKALIDGCGAYWRKE
jgi:hypothetical protein